MPYSDDTQQERYVREALDTHGYSFIEQCAWFPPYYVDFYLPELRMVIEADGHYGHFKKRDVKRDLDLMEHSMVDYVLHITSTTLTDIEDELWQGLNKFLEEENQERSEKFLSP